MPSFAQWSFGCSESGHLPEKYTPSLTPSPSSNRLKCHLFYYLNAIYTYCSIMPNFAAKWPVSKRSKRTTFSEKLPNNGPLAAVKVVICLQNILPPQTSLNAICFTIWMLYIYILQHNAHFAAKWPVSKWSKRNTFAAKWPNNALLAAVKVVICLQNILPPSLPLLNPP